MCAEKTGDDCLCNGRVIYGKRDEGEKAGHTHKAGDPGIDGIKATHGYWTV